MKETQNIHSYGSKKVWISFILAILLLVGAEAAVQTRAYMKGEEEPVKAVDEEGIYFFNEEYQLKLIQPNIVSDEGYRTVKSNSIGLRSPEISQEKQNNEIRVAILGGSSVMGMLNPVNEETISYRLEEHLQSHFNDKKVNVINAGIPGYFLTDQKVMYEKVLVPLKLDLLILYTGFNDVSSYCRDGGIAAENNGLINYSLPDWVLSIELLIKNSAILRELMPEVEQLTDPSTLNENPYTRNFEALLQTINASEVPVIVMANPRAYNRDMSPEDQFKYSEFSRSKDQCFSIEGLHEVYDRHNDIMVDISAKYDDPVLRLDQDIPGGGTYFADSIHLNAAGSEFVANLMVDAIMEHKLLTDEAAK